jgi:hypothetical protein
LKNEREWALICYQVPMRSDGNQNTSKVAFSPYLK